MGTWECSLQLSFPRKCLLVLSAIDGPKTVLNTFQLTVQVPSERDTCNRCTFQRCLANQRARSLIPTGHRYSTRQLREGLAKEVRNTARSQLLLRPPCQRDRSRISTSFIKQKISLGIHVDGHCLLLVFKLLVLPYKALTLGEEFISIIGSQLVFSPSVTEGAGGRAFSRTVGLVFCH